VQLEDGNCFNYGYIGSRAPATRPATTWSSAPIGRARPPAGIKKVFHSTTQFRSGLAARSCSTRRHAQRVKSARRLQAQPLSAYLKQPPRPRRRDRFPEDRQGVDEDELLRVLDFALQLRAAGPEEKEIRAKLAASESARARRSTDGSLPEQKAAMVEGMKEGDAKVDEYLAAGRRSSTAGRIGSLFGDRAFFHGNWLLRAAGAKAGSTATTRRRRPTR
jgi:hypothetical protein